MIEAALETASVMERWKPSAKKGVPPMKKPGALAQGSAQ